MTLSPNESVTTTPPNETQDATMRHTDVRQSTIGTRDTDRCSSSSSIGTDFDRCSNSSMDNDQTSRGTDQTVAGGTSNQSTSPGDGGGRRPGAPGLTNERLQALFHLNRGDAAKILGCGVTHLKKQCRQLGIKKWPQRQIGAIVQARTRLVHVKSTLLQGGHPDRSPATQGLDDCIVQLHLWEAAVRKAPSMCVGVDLQRYTQNVILKARKLAKLSQMSVPATTLLELPRPCEQDGEGGWVPAAGAGRAGTWSINVPPLVKRARVR